MSRSGWGWERLLLLQQAAHYAGDIACMVGCVGGAGGGACSLCACARKIHWRRH